MLSGEAAVRVKERAAVKGVDEGAIGMCEVIVASCGNYEEEEAVDGDKEDQIDDMR